MKHNNVYMYSTIGIPASYGARQDYPRIGLYLDGKYQGSMTWASGLEVARIAYSNKERVALYRVKAVFMKN